jgi:hypothetical protein
MADAGDTALRMLAPIQTIVVHSEKSDDNEVADFLLNAGILAGGLTLNRLGAWPHERQAAKRRVRAEVA